MFDTAAPFQFEQLASDRAQASFVVSGLRFLVDFRKDPMYRGSLWYITFRPDRATLHRFGASTHERFAALDLAAKAELNPIATASMVFTTVVAVMSDFARKVQPDGSLFGAIGIKRIGLYSRIADRKLHSTDYRREPFDDANSGRFLITRKDTPMAEVSRMKDWVEMSSFIRRAEVQKRLRITRIATS